MKADKRTGPKISRASTAQKAPATPKPKKVAPAAAKASPAKPAPAEAEKAPVRVKAAASARPSPKAAPANKPAPAKRTTAARKPVKAAKPAQTAVSSKPSASPEAAPKKKESAPRPDLPIPPLLLEGDLPPPQPLSGPGARYALSPEPIVAHSPSMSGGELPEAYGTKSLFLAARDPHWLHASWDMTMEQQRKFNGLSADGHLVVRIFSSESAPAVTEIHVHPESRSWFLNVPFAEHRYHAELGYYNARRNWCSIAISRSTFTPPEAPAVEVQADFATIPPEVTFQQIVAVVQEFAKENQPLLEAVAKAGGAELAESSFTAAHTPSAGASLHATEAFIAAIQESSQPAKVSAETPTAGAPAMPETAPHVFRARPVESPAALASGIKPVRSFRVDLPVRPGLAVRVERRGDWSSAQAKAVAQLISLDSYRRVWLGSLEITELIRRRLQEEMSSAAAADLAREQLEAGVSKELGAPSSFMGPAPEKGRGFWFKVNAELIIYGATDPKAKVTVAERRIKLREDGSFSFRFSLPDGRYHLPAVAVAPDGMESREARLEFSRSTEYAGQVQPHPQDPALRPPRAENVA